MQKKILLVEDDQLQRDLIVGLMEKDFKIIAVRDGEEALTAAEMHNPHLIVLDINIPKVNGFEVCRRLRLSPLTENTPVIMLTGSHDQDIRADAFDLGADDLLQKPFYSRELVSRIHAKLRIRKGTIPPPAQTLRFCEVSLNLQRMEVQVGAKRTRLSPLECSLISCFLREPESILSRTAIMKKVWGDTAVSQRTIDTHMVSLRKAIQVGGCRIDTVYGAGYILTCSSSKRHTQ